MRPLCVSLCLRVFVVANIRSPYLRIAILSKPTHPTGFKLVPVVSMMRKWPSDSDFFLRNFFGGFGGGFRTRSAGFRMSRPAILVEEIIDPGTRAFKRTIRWWNVHFQKFQLVDRF